MVADASGTGFCHVSFASRGPVLQGTCSIVQPEPVWAPSPAQLSGSGAPLVLATHAAYENDVVPCLTAVDSGGSGIVNNSLVRAVRQQRASTQYVAV